MPTLIIIAHTSPCTGQSTHQTTQPQKENRLYRSLGVDVVQAREGSAIAIGRDIRIGHVEGTPGDYLPNLQLPQFAGITAVRRSGPSKPNGHCTFTAKMIYGPEAVAPGVLHVHFFTTDDWLGKGFLQTMTSQPPRDEQIDIFTHSWIGNHQNRYGLDVLRRIDYLIDTNDQLMFAGVNNGADQPVPTLLGSGYNSIAVGSANGDSSGGYTVFDGQGRCKPDIVGYHSKTSFSTPQVAGVAARLLETARQMNDQPNADRAEVIKAILMAGAQKPAQWSASENKPLDEHFGAGRVKYDKSHAILTGGNWQPGAIGSRFGWSFESIQAEEKTEYRFRLTKQSSRVSIMLVWNRRIDGRWFTDLASEQTYWSNQPRLANFDLKLIAVDESEQEEIIAQSTSEVDNIEHIYLTSLPAGRYRMEVIRTDSLNEPWDYALAWRIEKRAGQAR